MDRGAWWAIRSDKIRSVTQSCPTQKSWTQLNTQRQITVSKFSITRKDPELGIKRY